MRIIGFNGPPRAGKDTLAAAIHMIHDDEYRFEPMKSEDSEVRYVKGRDWPWFQPTEIFSRACILPIRKVAFSILGREYSVEEYDQIKDVEQDAFGGETLRQFMLRLMEDYIKPRYGKPFAVKSMMNEFKDHHFRMNEYLLLVTDIGFMEEVEFLEALVGYDSFCLVRVHRNNTSYAGDSRSWCTASNEINFNNVINPLDGAANLMRSIYNKTGWEF